MEGVIRQVWKHNLIEELNLIRHLSDSCGYASIDTEFPGSVFKPKQRPSTMTCTDHYRLMKKNVDATHIIQLGLTLGRRTWEFNFCDFDPQRGLHDPDSVALLGNHGIDFSRNKRDGIPAGAFGVLFARMSGLVGPRSRTRAWIMFHGLYDLGYLMKIMTGKPLPPDVWGFMHLVNGFLGRHLYDLKAIAHGMGLRGGLVKVAEAVGLESDGDKWHQAGWDSLVTMHAFLRLVMIGPCAAHILVSYMGLLYGLTWLPSPPHAPAASET